MTDEKPFNKGRYLPEGPVDLPPIERMVFRTEKGWKEYWARIGDVA